ncbi:DUF1254 domain-containing protein [uncultured Paraglaciecola sp.]|uniref:DUF1254 domain-containing protein n=1 Tax=uncultured Paraglaciecola sp. TaxID=1765024 RepID=UPI00261297CA|nr:DUF1254 domain-containing protein [uncultured Paraglaciecola sp.]
MAILKKKRTYLLLTVAILLVVGFYSLNVVKSAARAYIFAYPINVMEFTRLSMVDKMGTNKINHLRDFPNHDFRQVVRPNNDTLYSNAWFDLSQEPMIISVPDIERYYVLPFMDAWTNVFGFIGSRTTGNQAGDYALVGPDFEGVLPDNIQRITAPTNMVWMIGRIHVYGEHDISNVAQIQDNIHVTALSKWSSQIPMPATVTPSNLNSNPVNPKAQVDELTPTEFFSSFAKLLAKQPAHARDKGEFDNFAALGLNKENQFDLADVNPIKRFLIAIGSKLANDKLHSALQSKGTSPKENGWIVWRDTLGEYGTNYTVRAGVTLGGLGALSAQEAAYPSADADINGENLHGSNQYELHFKAGQLPPVNAFWSLTMYNTDGYLIKNPINRYLVNNSDDLKFNEDGSLTIVIQHKQPKENLSNWLPAPAEEFSILLRLYDTTSAFTDGSWKLPPLERK